MQVALSSEATINCPEMMSMSHSSGDCPQLTAALMFCRHWLSLLILLSGMLLAFGVLLTISERFFCPALELISEYLQLPPVVAGATLLAFGNGAPDTFTQVAAVAQVGRHVRASADSDQQHHQCGLPAYTAGLTQQPSGLLLLCQLRPEAHGPCVQLWPTVLMLLWTS